ncbi:unnamed protein product, partial [Prorocentrum cordatum]
MADGVSGRGPAEVCVEGARGRLAAGDVEGALELLQRAKRLRPTDAAIDALIAEASPGGSAGPAAAGGAPAGQAPPEGARPRASAAAGGAQPCVGPGTARSGEDRTYTADDVSLVQRILRTRDHYGVLEIERGACEETVKRAYKKLALKLHPDKNTAPGAEEAFKKLSKAMNCLLDEGKRERYDRCGDEDKLAPQRHEDLFEATFRASRQRAQRQRQAHVQNVHALEHAWLAFVIALVIGLLAWNILFRDSGQGDHFSLSRTGRHRVQRSTAGLHVAFFVAEDFEDRYPAGTGALAELEWSVDVGHLRSLQSDCRYSSQVMQAKVREAERAGSRQDVEAARQHPRPACREVDRIRRAHPGLGAPGPLAPVGSLGARAPALSALVGGHVRTLPYPP